MVKPANKTTLMTSLISIKHHRKMARTAALVWTIGFFAASPSAFAIEYTPVDFDGKYQQNFDQLVRTRGVLAGTWKAGYQQKLEILPGWQAARIGKDGDTDIVLREMPGPTLIERLSIFATPNDKDRAFGGTSTKELTTAFGVALKNTTGRTIKRVKIGYANEVWAAPSGTPGQVFFSHGTSAAGITEANYLTNKAMRRLETPNAQGPKTVTPGEMLDGNAAANRAVISIVIGDLEWKPGETLFLAWTPSEAKQSSLGIDDLVVIDDELSSPSFTGEYRQNFDAFTLDAPASLQGTSQVNRQQYLPLLSGWQAARIGGSGKSNLGVAASEGADGSGKLYSFGRQGDNDRALGAISTQAASLALGTSFTNASGRTFQRIKVKYTAELWRTPARQIDKLLFSYGTSASGISERDYLTHQAMAKLEALDARVTTKNTDNVAVDGSAAQNRQEISGVIEGLEWKPGQTLFIAWTLQNGRGTGSGIGIDDLEVSAE